MTHFVLVRHGSTDSLHVGIAGWEAVPLNERGRREVAALAAREHGRIDALYTSPLARTHETALAIGAKLGLTPRPCEALAELRFGAWTGLTFEQLQGDPRWARFNTFRSGTRMPEGETVLEVQCRAVTALLELRDAHASGRVMLVSHGDVIKAIIAYVLGMSLDHMRRLEVAPASLSEIEIDDDGMRLCKLNQ